MLFRKFEMKGENGKEERFWQQKKKMRKSENQDWTRKERKNSQSSRQLACITMKHPLQSSHQMPSSWPFLIFTHLYTEHYTTREILMFMLRFLLQGKTQQDLVITIAPLPSPVSGTEKVPTKYAPEEKNAKKKKRLQSYPKTLFWMQIHSCALELQSEAKEET